MNLDLTLLETGHKLAFVRSRADWQRHFKTPQDYYRNEVIPWLHLALIRIAGREIHQGQQENFQKACALGLDRCI